MTFEYWHMAGGWYIVANGKMTEHGPYIFKPSARFKARLLRYGLAKLMEVPPHEPFTEVELEYFRKMKAKNRETQVA